jgi:carbon storage regulator CsrA
MLAITRRIGERLRIGPDIIVQVVDIRAGGMVRLGIEAPDDVPIERMDRQCRVSGCGVWRPSGQQTCPACGKTEGL